MRTSTRLSRFLERDRCMVCIRSTQQGTLQVQLETLVAPQAPWTHGSGLERPIAAESRDKDTRGPSAAAVQLPMAYDVSAPHPKPGCTLPELLRDNWGRRRRDGSTGLYITLVGSYGEGEQSYFRWNEFLECSCIVYMSLKYSMTISIVLIFHCETIWIWNKSQSGGPQRSSKLARRWLGPQQLLRRNCF